MAVHTLILLILQNLVPSYHTYLPWLLAVHGGSTSVTPLQQLGPPPFPQIITFPAKHQSQGQPAAIIPQVPMLGTAPVHSRLIQPHAPPHPTPRACLQIKASCMLKLLRVQAQLLPPGFRHTDLFSLLPLNLVHQSVSRQLLPFYIPHLNFDYSERK